MGAYLGKTHTNKHCSETFIGDDGKRTDEIRKLAVESSYHIKALQAELEVETQKMRSLGRELQVYQKQFENRQMPMIHEGHQNPKLESWEEKLEETVSTNRGKEDWLGTYKSDLLCWERELNQREMLLCQQSSEVQDLRSREKSVLKLLTKSKTLAIEYKRRLEDVLDMEKDMKKREEDFLRAEAAISHDACKRLSIVRNKEAHIQEQKEALAYKQRVLEQRRLISLKKLRDIKGRENNMLRMIARRNNEIIQKGAALNKQELTFKRKIEEFENRVEPFPRTRVIMGNDEGITSTLKTGHMESDSEVLGGQTRLDCLRDPSRKRKYSTSNSPHCLENNKKSRR